MPSPDESNEFNYSGDEDRGAVRPPVSSRPTVVGVVGLRDDQGGPESEGEFCELASDAGQSEPVLAVEDVRQPGSKRQIELRAERIGGDDLVQQVINRQPGDAHRGGCSPDRDFSGGSCLPGPAFADSANQFVGDSREFLEELVDRLSLFPGERVHLFLGKSFHARAPLSIQIVTVRYFGQIRNDSPAFVGVSQG